MDIINEQKLNQDVVREKVGRKGRRLGKGRDEEMEEEGGAGEEQRDREKARERGKGSGNFPLCIKVNMLVLTLQILKHTHYSLKENGPPTVLFTCIIQSVTLVPISPPLALWLFICIFACIQI